MPQFWLEDFAPQIVWLAISFALLYFLMSRVALPRITSVLEQRQERIAADLDRAAALREQAEKVLAEYEAAVTQARSEARGIIAEQAAAAAAEADRRQQELGDRLQREANAAAARIDAAKTQALGEVRTIAAELAAAAAGRLLGSEVAADDAAGAVDAAINERA
ncbi:MAG: F0F1 ATP synthase subunit B' [Alphaproteobacteria bacterium]